MDGRVCITESLDYFDRLLLERTSLPIFSFANAGHRDSGPPWHYRGQMAMLPPSYCRLRHVPLHPYRIWVFRGSQERRRSGIHAQHTLKKKPASYSKVAGCHVKSRRSKNPVTKGLEGKIDASVPAKTESQPMSLGIESWKLHELWSGCRVRGFVVRNVL